jgi:hypothetical protein
MTSLSFLFWTAAMGTFFLLYRYNDFFDQFLKLRALKSDWQRLTLTVILYCFAMGTLFLAVKFHEQLLQM